MKVEGICFRCDVPLSLSGLLKTKGTVVRADLVSQNIETSRGYNFSEMNHFDQVREVRYLFWNIFGCY